MSNKSEFRKMSQQVRNAIETGTKRALAKAAKSGKSVMAKSLARETGLPQKRLKSRVWTDKVKETGIGLTSGVTIGIKYGISLSEFKPKTKKVKVTPRNSKRRRTYYGATVKIGRQQRLLVPGGFIGRGKNSDKELVFKRRGIGRLPVDALKAKIVNEAVESSQDAVKTAMTETFNKNLDHEVSFAMKKQSR